MLECPAVPNIFLDRQIRYYRKRAFRKCCPETVLLSMKKEPQRSYFEKIEIYSTPVAFSEDSQASSQVQCISPKRQARVLPNILRNSTSKTQLESETNSIGGQSAIPELQRIMEVDTAENRRQSRKRKQDYKQANIRQDPSDTLGIKRTAHTAGIQTQRSRKMTRLSMDKKKEKEVPKSKENDSSEDTEDFQNNTSLSSIESEMPESDSSSITDECVYPNQYSFPKETEKIHYDEFIDFSSNDIFSRCYYDSYSEQSLESSLELNERLDDIQSILNLSFNRDTFVEQYHISRNITSEEMLESQNYIPQLGNSLSKSELSAEELGWMNEWLSGKEIELDVIFENSHIRERFSNLSAETFNSDSDSEADSLEDNTRLPEQTSNTDWNEANIAPIELIEDLSDFMEFNISLNDEEKGKIFQSDELAETLMKEIDEIDTTDLLRSRMIDSDETLSCEELTEIMLSALMEEAYPNSKNNVTMEASKEAEKCSNTTEDINEKQSEKAATYSNNKNNDIDDEEMIEVEACPSNRSDTGNEELEWGVESTDDSTDSLATPKSNATPLASDIDSNSSTNDEEQKNDRPAVPLRKRKTKRKKPMKPKTELYQCSICPLPLRFRYSRTLKLHVEAAHKGLYDLVCEICDRRFNKQYTYNRHVANCRWLKEKFECDECGKEYRHKSSLVAHRRSKHEKDDGVESQKHVCAVCSKTFVSAGRYNSHVRSHKNDW